MRPQILFVTVLVALGLAGCASAIRSSPIEATDYSSIEVGATREAVESVLGSPI